MDGGLGPWYLAQAPSRSWDDRPGPWYLAQASSRSDGLSVLDDFDVLNGFNGFVGFDRIDSFFDLDDCLEQFL